MHWSKQTSLTNLLTHNDKNVLNDAHIDRSQQNQYADDEASRTNTLRIMGSRKKMTKSKFLNF